METPPRLLTPFMNGPYQLLFHNPYRNTKHEGNLFNPKYYYTFGSVARVYAIWGGLKKRRPLL